MAYSAPPFDLTQQDNPSDGWLPGALGDDNGFGAPVDPSMTAAADPIVDDTDDASVTTDTDATNDQLLATVESALSGFLEQDKNNAVTMHQPRKYEVAKYKQQLDGQGLADDPTDPLVNLGCYLPIAAHKIDVLKANILREIAPDPAENIAFDIQSEVLGLEYFAKKASAGLRRKVISATPAAADTVYDLVNMWLTDFFGCGASLAINGHEGTADDANRDGIRQGPVPQYIDFMNWWPNAYDVNRPAQCDHYIYAPIDIYQFKAGKYENEAEALQRCSATQNTRRDTDSFDQYQYQNNLLWWQYTTERLYRRYIYIGKWPGEDLRMRAGLDGVSDEDMIIALADKYGAQDPELYIQAAQQSYWWHIEFCDGVLLRVQPYPLMVPAGQCPLIMSACFKRNGLLMPYGLFDRGASWSDRLANFYYRAGVHITKAAMNPPWYYREGMIKQSWLNQQGTEQPSLVQGVGIPIVSDENTKPIETIRFNIEAVPISQQQRALHENDLADLTGSVDALQGTAQSKTATQDQNNLQQSQTFANFYSREFGKFVVQVLKGMYVIWIQSMEMGGTGYTEYAPADMDSQGMRMVTITRQDLLSLEFLEFMLTGPSAPGNRMNQSVVVGNLTAKYLPLGILNPFKTAEAEFEIAGVSALMKPCLQQPDMFALIQGQQNRQALLGGPGAQAMTDPNDTQILQAMQQQAMGAANPAAPPMQNNEQSMGNGLPAGGPQGNTPLGGQGGTGGFAGRQM